MIEVAALTLTARQLARATTTFEHAVAKAVSNSKLAVIYARSRVIPNTANRLNGPYTRRDYGSMEKVNLTDLMAQRVQ